MVKTITYNNDKRLAYTEFGERTGFPILIQHGLIASIEDHHLFEKLCNLGARLICAARPGYGESSPYQLTNILAWAEAIANLVDHLSLEQFDILGISSGAPYSYAIGARFPEKVRNIYILSGTPALYTIEIQSHWPYPLNQNAGLPALQALAYELFFSNLSKGDLQKKDIHDSMRNNCFGPALDLNLRCRDWGFQLTNLSANVFMRHSRYDDSIPHITAELTAGMIRNCTLYVVETDIHFSNMILDEFIEQVIADFYEKN